MRSFLNSGFVAVFLYSLLQAERATLCAAEPSDSLKPNTVWKGEVVYEETDYRGRSEPIPVVLYVKQRKGAAFEGVTWYPTEENGLLMVAGRVGEKGAVTLSEVKVIHGRAAAGGNKGVQAGMKYVGQRDNITIKGSGEWTGPAFNGPIRATFRLKLAG